MGADPHSHVRQLVWLRYIRFVPLVAPSRPAYPSLAYPLNGIAITRRLGRGRGLYMLIS